MSNQSDRSDCAKRDATWTANERAKRLPGGGELPEETAARQKCIKETCDIQTCLKDNDYKHNKCTDVINEYHKCIAKYKNT